MSFLGRTLSYRGPSSHLRHGPLRREISTHNIPGVYFKPTPQDLIDFLNKKIRGDYCPVGNALRTFNLGDSKPERLVDEYHYSLEMSNSDLAKLQMKNVIYFFIDRSGERKKSGWGQTGKPSDIRNEDGDKMGSKRYLSYRESRSDGKKMTTWIIHEYSSNLDHPDKDKFSICKLMKSDEGKRKEEAETRGDASTSGNTPQVFSSTYPSLTTDTSGNQQVSYGAIENFGSAYDELFTEGSTFQMFSSTYPSLTTDTSGNQQVSYGAIANFGSAYDELFTEGSTFQMFSSTNPPPYLHESGENSSTHSSLTTPYMSGNQQVSYGAIAYFRSTCDEMFSSTHSPPHLHQSGQNSSTHPSLTTSCVSGNQQLSYPAMPLYQPSHDIWDGDSLSSHAAAVSNDTTIPESDGVDGGDDPFGFLNLLNVTFTDVENLF